MVAEQDVAVDNIVENTALVNDHMDGGIKEMVKTKETLISIRKRSGSALQLLLLSLLFWSQFLLVFCTSDELINV